MFEVKRIKDTKRAHNMRDIKEMFTGRLKGDHIIQAIQGLQEKQRREAKKKKKG